MNEQARNTNYRECLTEQCKKLRQKWGKAQIFDTNNESPKEIEHTGSNNIDRQTKRDIR